jgi:hypothetical protein
LKIDKTPPVITAARTPEPNKFGWNNTPVTLSFQCTDDLSGSDGEDERIVVPPRAPINHGQPPVSMWAGNGTTSSVEHIDIDVTPPELATLPDLVIPHANGAGAVATYPFPGDAQH